MITKLLKTCYVCERGLPLERFNKNRSKPDGLATECKDCKSEQDKEYRRRYKEKIKSQKHEYYLENKDGIVQRACQYAKDNRLEHNRRGKKAKEKLKLEVFSEYCTDEVQCKCGVRDLDILSIDHINGDGAEHRREIYGYNNGGGGYNFYRWLKKNSYPEGFQVLCFNCQFRKRAVELKPENPTHLQEVRARYVRKVKLECLEAYGGFQCTCGEDDADVMTLDHVNDDGAEHRRKTDTRGYNFYIMLRKNGFPNDPPLQVLCLNCNQKKKQNFYDSEVCYSKASTRRS